ncbi:MAG: AAA family ATPase [Prevotellaceae bacterium]|jgi:hypothetical protein|nr:AAA family ATPase [Prevotellaceae bacterium]
MPSSHPTSNPELLRARGLIENTGANLFLTGKAGTGKTTFLRALQEESPKRMIVTAPTGVAARNAGGLTLHSFFQLPFSPHLPGTLAAGSPSGHYRFSKEKINLLRSIDLLVIDEISMVRADLLDAVDEVLRRYRDRYAPFGGVQLLLIGDLGQLAPVVKEEEWALLGTAYATPYFFSSHALQESVYHTIELTHVYRQRDSRFLHLLNAIRENRCDAAMLAELNRRYLPDFHPPRGEGYIRLVTHNHQAQRINEGELEQLHAPAGIYRATVSGTFPAYLYPTDEVLTLKRGAQVMFVKNDSSGEHSYYNGLIGEVTALSPGGIEVTCRETGQIITLHEEEWQNVRYALDAATGEIRQEVEGLFKQYPLKLAWAVTIHKAQGLTFEHAVIDAGHSFAHGQTYVALSRCRTLEGLVLSAPLKAEAIINDPAVEGYIDAQRANGVDEARYVQLQQDYLQEQLTALFNFRPLSGQLGRFLRLLDEYLFRLYPHLLEAYHSELPRVRTRLVDVGDTFARHFPGLIAAAVEQTGREVLQERVRAGAAYFAAELQPLVELRNASDVETDNKEVRKRIAAVSDELDRLLAVRVALLDYVGQHGFHLAEYLRQKALLTLKADQPRKKSRKQPAASSSSSSRRRAKADVGSDILHPELFEDLRLWRARKAADQGVPPYVILHQVTMIGICNLQPASKEQLLLIPYFGPKRVEQFGDELLAIVSRHR